MTDEYQIRIWAQNVNIWHQLSQKEFNSMHLLEITVTHAVKKKLDAIGDCPVNPRNNENSWFSKQKKNNIFKTFYKNFWTVDIKVLLTKISYRFCNFFFINFFFLKSFVHYSRKNTRDEKKKFSEIASTSKYRN